MKTTITNISKARQGIQTPNGLAWIKPDETRTLDLDEESHARVIELSDLLEVDGAPVAHGNGEPKAKDAEPLDPDGDDDPANLIVDDTFDAMTDEQLAALYLDQFGKAPHHKAKRETIIAKLRGE